MNQQWYCVLSYVFLILIVIIQVISLAILCKCSRRLVGLRYQQMKILFVWTLLQYIFRLVYEIAYHLPIQNYNVLCWILRLCIELTTILSWTKVAIIAGYYYAVLKTKTDAMGRQCNICMCVTNWTIPVLPVLCFGLSFVSPDFYEPNSCWKGTTNQLLNIIEFVDHLFLLFGTLFYAGTSYFYLWWRSPETIQVLSGHVPSIKNKNHLVTAYLVFAILMEIPITIRAFEHQAHDILVVSSWCAIGLAAPLCFCFLDSEIQRAFFAHGDASLGSSTGSQGSDVNLTQEDVLDKNKQSQIQFLGKSRKHPDYSGAGTLSLRSLSCEDVDNGDEQNL